MASTAHVRGAAKRVALGCLALLAAAEFVCGQSHVWSTASYTPATYSGMNSPAPRETITEPARARRGALARLIRNPDSSGGMPPFALTDQAGTIQRYVEPVDGISLEAYVDQVVVVRHDTGRTLLASQLELPQQPLLPMLNESSATGRLIKPLSSPVKLLDHQERIQRVQFADDDDATVELLPEKDSESQPAGPGGSTMTGRQGDIVLPGGQDATGRETASGPVLETTIAEGDKSIDGTLGEGELIDPHAAEWNFLEPCPECGGHHSTPECSPAFDMRGGPVLYDNPPPSRLFVDVEFNFFRTHMIDTLIGKLSEKYEFSPRVTLGFRDTGKLDGRARYWSYDHDTRSLAGGTLNVEFDVLDLEGTYLFLGQRSELLLASGLRMASIDLSEGGTTAGADLLGITLAADGRTCLCEIDNGLFTWAYGGRLSILGGDWGGEAGNAFVTSLTQDDNVIVHELHAGIDYAVCYRDFDFHTRFGFEMQNWQSDALTQNSIGILGPSFQFGAEF
jgi:hypothetical protein